MTQIYSLSIASREFCRETMIRAAGNLQPVSLAVARVAAYSAVLPPVEVVDFDSHYRSQVAVGINDIIDELNENYVKVNYRQTLEYAKLFYYARYLMVYPNKTTMLCDVDALQFFGITDAVSPELLKIIREEGPSLGRLIHGLGALLRELKELKTGAVEA